jgi:gamma-glutamyl:cysteine ligase YbdK (ATP-grasp superfamily)
MIYLNTELINTIVIQEIELWENIRPIPAVNTIENLYIILLLSIVNLINKLYKWDYC